MFFRRYRAEYTDGVIDLIPLHIAPPDKGLGFGHEQVWRITRRENTHNVFFPSLTLLEETVDSAFGAWAVPNDQLKSLCTFK